MLKECLGTILSKNWATNATKIVSVKLGKIYDLHIYHFIIQHIQGSLFYYRDCLYF